MGTNHAGKKGPSEMADTPGLFSPGLRMTHPDEQEIGEIGEETGMDKQVIPVVAEV